MPRSVLPIVGLAAVLALSAGCARGRGRLSVVSSPLGEVIVDGRPTGRRTPAPDIMLSPGEHRVAVRFPGGRRSDEQRIVVGSDRPAYVYARPARAASTDHDCESGPQDACFEAITSALRAGARATAARRAARYVERFPDGAYHRLARSVVANLATVDAGGADRAGETAVAVTPRDASTQPPPAR